MKPIILFLCGFFALYSMGAQEEEYEYEDNTPFDSVVVHLKGQVKFKSGGYECYPKLSIFALDSSYEVTGDAMGRFEVDVILTYEDLSFGLYKEQSETGEEWNESDLVPESEPLIIKVKRIKSGKPATKFDPSGNLSF